MAQSKHLDNRDLNNLVFSDDYLEIIGRVPKAKIGDICQVHTPNWPAREGNTGFTIKNLDNDDIYQVVDTVDKFHREMHRDLDFFIISWKDFRKYFQVVDKGLAESQLPFKEETIVEEKKSYPFRASLTILTFFVGLCLIGWSVETIIGILLILSSIAALVATDFWDQYDELPSEKRIIAMIPVVLGAIISIGGVVLFLFWKASQTHSRKR